MSGRIKTVIGVTAYLLACTLALWQYGIAALGLVVIATFGGAMIYKDEADDAQELCDELLKLQFRMLDNMKDLEKPMNLDDVREMLESMAQEADDE